MPTFFSRADSVATRILLAVIFAGTALVAVVLPVCTWLRGGALTRVVDTGLAGTLTISSATVRPDADVLWPGTAQVRLEDASGGVWAWQVATGATLTLVVGIVVVLLICLLRRIQQESEFSRSTVMLLRLLALNILAGVVAIALLGSIADAEIIDAAFERDEMSLSLTLFSVPQVVALAVALVVAAAAEVVARGERLSKDVEGLV